MLRLGLCCGLFWGCGAHNTANGDNAQADAQHAAVKAATASDLPPAAAASAPPAKRAGVEGFRRRPSARETRVISELMTAAERVRQLRFARPVPVWVENRARITDYVSSQIQEDELERARVVYTALGLLSPSLDVRALLLRLLGEQVVGYYDADSKHLVVRDDIMRGFAAKQTTDAETPNDLAEARIVLLHELVHALQDQQLGLSLHIHEDRDTDASNAFHALVEGDATLAMIGYALEGERIPLRRLTSSPAQVRSFSEVVRRSPLAGSELEQAPAIVRIPLLSSYVDGLAFCASLHGLSGFRGVDSAHAKPPSSTEEILHPERFTAKAGPDVPTAIQLPQLQQLEQAGYELVREDTLGELEMGVYFGQALTAEQARRAADGWDGDRIRVYRATNRPAAVVWLSVWDNEREAEQAEQAAERVLRAAGKAGAARGGVYRRGSWLLILRELQPELRSALASRLLSAR
jgi:hypothetical protein